MRVESRSSVAPEVDVVVSITHPQDGQRRLPPGTSPAHEGQRITRRACQNVPRLGKYREIQGQLRDKSILRRAHLVLWEVSEPRRVRGS